MVDKINPPLTNFGARKLPTGPIAGLIIIWVPNVLWFFDAAK